MFSAKEAIDSKRAKVDATRGSKDEEKFLQMTSRSPLPLRSVHTNSTGASLRWRGRAVQQLQPPSYFIQMFFFCHISASPWRLSPLWPCNSKTTREGGLERVRCLREWKIKGRNKRITAKSESSGLRGSLQSGGITFRRRGGRTPPPAEAVM